MRLPYIPPTNLSAEQRVLFDDMRQLIASHLNVFQSETEDGSLIGPWNPWLHEPIIGGAIWQFVKTVTANATLPEEARQVAILVVGGRLRAAYELYAHVAVAKARGLDSVTISAIVAGSRPENLSENEAAAYDVAFALTQSGPLPAVCYSRALKVFGQHGLNELIYLVGAYFLVSVTLNGFNVAAPDND